jgi:hypothetical protein
MATRKNKKINGKRQHKRSKTRRMRHSRRGGNGGLNNKIDIFIYKSPLTGKYQTIVQNKTTKDPNDKNIDFGFANEMDKIDNALLMAKIAKVPRIKFTNFMKTLTTEDDDKDKLLDKFDKKAEEQIYGFYPGPKYRKTIDIRKNNIKTPAEEPI